MVIPIANNKKNKPLKQEGKQTRQTRHQNYAPNEPKQLEGRLFG
jgi:hypothetical protein